jgi:hypothetical protein
MEFTHPGRHERKVERFIRDMRNGIRTVVHSLSYQLPRKLYPDLVANIIATTNMLPSAKSSPITPQEIVVGIKPDKSLDLRNSEQSQSSRGEMGIVLRRDFYSRGAVKAFIISKGRVMTRGQFQTIDVTEEIKQELLKISATDQVQEDKLINAIGDPREIGRPCIPTRPISLYQTNL